MAGRFEGRRVLVTGGASGIGAATVERFLAEGARVAIADANLEAARKFADGLAAKGRVSAFGVDVIDQDDVQRMFDEVTDALGGVDILVNSAGIREIVPVLELSLDTWNKIIGVNLNGTFIMSQIFANALVARQAKGAIVNVSSTSSIMAARDRAAYVASKHGVSGLTKQFALDLGKHGVRVNAVAPSVTRTPLTASYFVEPEKEAAIAAAYPLGRICMPEEVASVITFLASDDASFVHGAIVPVDGGFTAGRL